MLAVNWTKVESEKVDSPSILVPILKMTFKKETRLKTFFVVLVCVIAFSAYAKNEGRGPRYYPPEYSCRTVDGQSVTQTDPCDPEHLTGEQYVIFKAEELKLNCDETPTNIQLTSDSVLYDVKCKIKRKGEDFATYIRTHTCKVEGNEGLTVYDLSSVYTVNLPVLKSCSGGVHFRRLFSIERDSEDTNRRVKK